MLLYSICYLFHSTHKSGSVVSKWSSLHLFFFMHVPDKKLGLEPVEPLQDWPCQAFQKPMGEDNKDDGVGDPFKMFLKESLAQQRNEMMDNFAQILQRLPIGDASSSSGHATPFKL